MHILVSLLVSVLVIEYVGFGSTRLLLGKNPPIPAHVLALVTGYAVAQVAFFHSYFLLGGAVPAAMAVFALSTILNAVYLVSVRHELRRSLRTWIQTSALRDWRQRLAVAAAGLVVVVSVGSPYLRAGWNQYWHGGNPDAIDALYGRDAYLQNLLGSSVLDSYVILGDIKPIEQLYSDRPLDAKYFRESYSQDTDRQQYSSVAFWSLIFDSYAGLDAFLIQCLLCLMLMLHGVYWLMRLSLRSPPVVALIGALLSVGNVFYITTYFNEHEGSLIYGAMAPVVLLVGLKFAEGWRLGWWVGMVAVWLYCLLFTYPSPLAFVLPPIAVYAAYRRVIQPRGLDLRVRRWLAERWSTGWQSGRAQLLVGGIAALAIALAMLFVGYVLLEPLRLRAVTVYRSWGYIESWVAPFLFWGLWPGPMQTISLVAEMQNPLGLAWSALAAVVLSAGVIWTFLVRLARRSAFWPIYMFVWLCALLALSFGVSDSYYLYKFLYTQQFILIAGLVAVVATAWQTSGRIRRGAIGLFGAGVVASNLTAGSMILGSVSTRPYNQDAALYADVLSIPQSLLQQTYVDIPHRDSGAIVRELLAGHELPVVSDPNDAQFLLEMKGDRDVITSFDPPAAPVWDSPLFQVVPAPARDVVRVYARYTEPDNVNTRSGPYADTSFLWRGNYYEDTFAIVPRGIDDAAHYLRMCIEPGPSIDYQRFVLHGYGSDGRELAQIPVSSFTCTWLDLASLQGFSSPWTFTAGVVGHSLLPADDRVLNYRVSRVGLTADRYDAFALQALNDSADIADSVSPAAPGAEPSITPDSVLLGNGWYPLEQSGSDRFRWAADSAEVVVYDPTSASTPISLDVEPGPSLAHLPADFTVRDETGRVVTTASISGRQTLHFSVATQPGRTRILHLQANGGGEQDVPGDPRRLNFRVFSIGSGDYDAQSLVQTNNQPDIGPPTAVATLKQTGHLPADGVFVGKNWYPFENFDGLSFRWVDNDADVVITQPSATTGTLVLDVEPGPGLGSDPLDLQVLDGKGDLLARRTIDGRQTLNLPVSLPGSGTQVIRLHTQGGGYPSPNDPRSLNFRVFAVRWQP